VARINFSHGSRDNQRRRVELVRAAATNAGRLVAVLADLAGPKIRIESFREGAVQLVEGAPFALDTDLEVSGSVNFPAGAEQLYHALIHAAREGHILASASLSTLYSATPPSD